VIVRARTRRSVVGAARRDRGFVERPHLRTPGRAERDVDLVLRRALADPELGLATDAKASELFPLHHELEAERRERFRVERDALVEIGDLEAGVIDHGATILDSSRLARCGVP